jgi:hypothetical protein
MRHDGATGQEIVEFLDEQGAKSVVMSDGIIGCPHQQGIDYDTDWCPECGFWKGRDRFTGKRLSRSAEITLCRTDKSLAYDFEQIVR